MNMGYTLAAILVSALCTLALRALPFLCFGKNRPVPPWLTRLGQALPPAIMAVLVIYCLPRAIISFSRSSACGPERAGIMRWEGKIC